MRDSTGLPAPRSRASGKALRQHRRVVVRLPGPVRRGVRRLHGAPEDTRPPVIRHRESTVSTCETLAGLRTRRHLGDHDQAGNALWTEGELLVDSVHRFKGQSAPVIVLCEIDFDALGDKELCKLFVGMTRSRFRLECVLSEPAAALLMQLAG